MMGNGDVTDADLAEIGGVIPDGIWASGLNGEYTYSGEAITMNNLRVYNHMTLLNEGTDYSVSYENNVNAFSISKEMKKSQIRKAPAIILKGTGQYKDTGKQYFTIEASDISEKADLTVKESCMVFRTAGKLSPIPTVYIGSVLLKKGKDYSVSYINEDGTELFNLNNAPEGNYKVKIQGAGNYKGTKESVCEIALIDSSDKEKVLMSSVKVSKIEAQKYTGNALEPVISVKSGKNGQVLNAYDANTPSSYDYSVKYINNIEIGKATIVIKGNESAGYYGEKQVSFDIVGTDIKKVDVNNFDKEIEYTGRSVTQDLVLVDSNRNYTLIRDDDYCITYQNNLSVGTATVLITGKGSYSGSISKKFQISKYKINRDAENAFNVDDIPDMEYQKGGCYPKPTVYFDEKKLTENVDYSVKYKNTKNTGNKNSSNAPTVIITGKGNFSGTFPSAQTTFSINKRDICDLTLFAADVQFSEKNGNAISPLAIIDRNGKSLKAGDDYNKKSVVNYYYAQDVIVKIKKGKEYSSIKRYKNECVENNDIVPAGTMILASMAVRNGNKSNYSAGTNDTLSTTYKVTKASLKNAKISIPAQLFTGAAITPAKEQITVKCGNVKLSNTDYRIISFRNNVNQGKATVIIEGRGNYGSQCAGTFTISKYTFSSIISALKFW